MSYYPVVRKRRMRRDEFSRRLMRENSLSAKLVEKYGWISFVGKYDKINYNNLVTNVLDLIKNKRKLKNMTHACSQIDGLGPMRVANHIIALK